MKSLLALLSVLMLPSSFACDISTQEMRTLQVGMRPDSQEKFFAPEISPNRGEVSKADWEGMIKVASEFYIPVFKKLGYKLVVYKDWGNNEENAFAAEDGKVKFLVLYGGYARRKEMTKDAYLSIVCHEIGHHLGGHPKRGDKNLWSTVEGGADYFSTLKCMKELLRKDPKNEEIASGLDLPKEVKASCRKEYPAKNDYHICLRSAKASEDYGNMLVGRRGEKGSVDLLTPDTSRVRRTNLKHPESQCRADTKYAGALCNISTAIDVGLTDEAAGTCYRRDTVGVRPACWFKSQL